MRYSRDKLDIFQANLYTAVIADILDELCVKNFSMKETMLPILGTRKMIGYARTLYVVDIFETPSQPYETDLRFIDSLADGDVFVSTVNGSNRNGFFGELLATACAARGVRGTVLEGYARDIDMIDKMGFPLYCLGMNPLDSKGRVDAIEQDKAILCSGVLVFPGDMIFADLDGIVCIPQKHIETVIAKALEKIKGEDMVREELRRGVSIKEVFDRYGIL